MYLDLQFPLENLALKTFKPCRAFPYREKDFKTLHPICSQDTEGKITIFITIGASPIYVSQNTFCGILYQDFQINFISL